MKCLITGRSEHRVLAEGTESMEGTEANSLGGQGSWPEPWNEWVWGKIDL